MEMDIINIILIVLICLFAFATFITLGSSYELDEPDYGAAIILAFGAMVFTLILLEHIGVL